MKVHNVKLRKVLREGKVGIQVEFGTNLGNFKTHVPLRTSFDELERKFLIVKRVFETSFESLKEFDEKLKKLDGTQNYSYLNELALAFSSCALKGFASENGMEIYEYIDFLIKGKAKVPKPLCYFVDTKDIKYLLLAEKDFSKNLFKLYSLHSFIGQKLEELGKFHGLNQMFSWVCELKFNQVLELLEELRQDFKLGISFDVWDGKSYSYRTQGFKFKTEEQLSFLLDLDKAFSLGYLEYPFQPSDLASHRRLKEQVKGIIANEPRYSLEDYSNALDALILDPSNFGTITELLEVCQKAKNLGLKLVMSLSFDWIADLASGVSVDYLKFNLGQDLSRVLELESRFQA